MPAWTISGLYQDACLGAQGLTASRADVGRQSGLHPVIISLLNERMDAGMDAKKSSFLTVTTMFQAARVVGETIREVGRNEKEVSEDNPGLVSGTFILGGQIHGEPPRLFHIYKEGNFIEATKDTSYFQIGEHKYGKPILDRVANPEMRMPVAAKLLLISFDSTLRSNLSVGMPIDMLIYYRDTLEVTDQRRIAEKDPNFRKISEGWSQALRDAFAHIDDYGRETAHAGTDHTMPTTVTETTEAEHDQLAGRHAGEAGVGSRLSPGGSQARRSSRSSA
jgi:putative proteasome-type protease